MLVGVMSDTHDEMERTAQAVELFVELQVEMLFHCGDITTRPIIEICAELPLYFVFGNHDSDTVPVLQAAARDTKTHCLEWGGLVEIEGIKLGATHGHMKSDIQPLLRAEPDFLLTGHFHERAEWMQGNIKRVCPGALHRTDKPSVATINTKSQEVVFHELR